MVCNTIPCYVSKILERDLTETQLYRGSNSLQCDSSTNLNLSSQDLSYGTETERDIEAAHEFITSHGNKAQPHIIPMWNKRSDMSFTSPSGRIREDKLSPAQRVFVKSADGELSFDPLLRELSATGQAPYFINNDNYDNYDSVWDNPTDRNSPNGMKRKVSKIIPRRSVSSPSVRKDFVLLGLDLGGGFIERRLSKSLQKRMELSNQNSSGKSMRALRVSIMVAINVTVFYSLFIYIWVMQTLYRYTSLDVGKFIFDINDKLYILGPLYIAFLPTFSSLVDPIIYFFNKTGVLNVIKSQLGSKNKDKCVKSNLSKRARERNGQIL